MRTILFVLLLGGLASACEREVAAVSVDYHYAYFPLAVGQSWQYVVDSIVLRSQVGGIFYDSVRLFAREVLLDTLRDGAGQLWFRGERHERRADTLPWQYRQTFLLGRDARQALRREDNLNFVKLLFPPRANDRWDGNAGFDAFREIAVGGQSLALFVGWEYGYTGVHEPGMVGNYTFDSLLTVTAADYENLIDRRVVREQYAPGRGLVYREVEALHTQCQQCCGGNTSQCLDLPWRQKAEKGFILRQWLQ